MDHRGGTLSPELTRLRDGLRLHSRSEGGVALLMNPADTSFAGTTTDDLDTEGATAINAVGSIPCHY